MIRIIPHQLLTKSTPTGILQQLQIVFLHDGLEVHRHHIVVGDAVQELDVRAVFVAGDALLPVHNWSAFDTHVEEDVAVVVGAD